MSAPHSANNSDGEEEVGAGSQELDDCIENMTEKRGSTRESAIASFIKLARTSVLTEALENNCETIMDALKKSLKRGSKEQALAATALPLLQLSVPNASQVMVQEVVPVLKEVLTSSDAGLPLDEVVHALAMNVFLVGGDEAETVELLQLLFALSMSSRSVASAVSGWTLLASTLPAEYVCHTLVPGAMAALVGLLSAEEVETRVAAGDALAFLVEQLRHRDPEYDLQLLSEHFDVDAMLDTLEALVADKTKSRAKKDRLKQKLPFKDIAAYIIDGVAPSETLSIKQQRFEFATWQRLLRLNALRETLAEGFQAHFEANQMVQDILESHVQADFKKEKLNSVQKRMIMSPSSLLSKERSKQRNKQRSWRDIDRDF